MCLHTNVHVLLSDLPQTAMLTGWVENLTLEDRRVLCENEWLNANHISTAHKLMLRTFPLQNGLQDTHYLAKKMSWCSVPKGFVQIIYVSNCHWACVSNKLCTEENTVELYDSMLTIPGETIQEQVSTIMNCEASAITLKLVNVQQQQSCHACGLYSIAIAVDLCLGQDPSSALYDESSMRNHLEACFSKAKISQFPQKPRSVRRRILDEMQINIYCICRYPEVTSYFGNMICCESCEEWYHEHCLQIPSLAALKKSIWICPRCQ